MAIFAFILLLLTFSGLSVTAHQAFESDPSEPKPYQALDSELFTNSLLITE